MGVEDFLLGRNFLRSYQVLVDLTSMKIVVRAPVKPVWHHAHTQVGDASLTIPIALDSDLVLQPFERTVAKAKLVTNALEPLIFQTVALNASLSDPSLQNTIFLEDSVATVSETGTLYLSLVNLTSNQQRVRCGAHLGTVVPVSLVYQAVPQKLDATAETDHKTEADNSRANFVYKVYSEMNLSTASELTSSSEFEFLDFRIQVKRGFRSARFASAPIRTYWPRSLGPILNCKKLKNSGALAPASPWTTFLTNLMTYS